MSCSTAIPQLKSNLDFSIEEIRNQLSTMGVTDLSNIELVRLKRHLDGIIRREQGVIPSFHNRNSEQGGEDFTTTALSHDSSTPRTLSRSSISSSFTIPHESDPVGVNQAWREPGPLKGTLYAPTQSNSLNSNQAPLQSSMSNQLLTVPTMQYMTRRIGSNIHHSNVAEIADFHSQRSASETNSSLDSDGQTPNPSDKKPIFVSATTPRTKLSISTASEASESTGQLSQLQQEVSLPMRMGLKTTATSLGGRMNRIRLKDEGDFESGLALSGAYSMGNKEENKWGTDPDAGLNALRCPALLTPQNISAQCDGIERMESYWRNTMLASQIALVSSHKNSLTKTQSGSTRRHSGRLQNMNISKNSRSNSSGTPVFHSHVDLEKKPEAYFQKDNQNGDLVSCAVSCKGARVGKQFERNFSEFFTGEHTRARRSSRNRSPANVRRVWIKPERSACKVTCVPSPSSSVSSVTVESTKLGHTSRSQRSYSRSARFPNNPVAKIHNWQPRPRTTSVERSDSAPTQFRCSQTTKSSLSSSIHVRRQDPVKRYHSYQRSWLANLVPGEDARRVLRWNIRTAMMHREVPLLQRNLPEVTQLFGPSVAAMLTRERQRKLKALNLEYIRSIERHQLQNRTPTVNRPYDSASMRKMSLS